MGLLVKLLPLTLAVFRLSNVLRSPPSVLLLFCLVGRVLECHVWALFWQVLYCYFLAAGMKCSLPIHTDRKDVADFPELWAWPPRTQWWSSLELLLQFFVELILFHCLPFMSFMVASALIPLPSGLAQSRAMQSVLRCLELMAAPQLRWCWKSTREELETWLRSTSEVEIWQFLILLFLK